MATARKKGDQDTAAKTRLMEATIEVILEEGYAAATSRKVAARAGVKQALVYYYFPTMDDLFLAVVRGGAEVTLARQRQALEQNDPLRALWMVSGDARATKLNTEFMALANHRKIIGAELKRSSERIRDIETAAVTMVLRARGVDLEKYPPMVMSMILTGMARNLRNEEAVGVTAGHAALTAFVEGILDQFDGTAST
ncbi:TetR family transcriptional regulator [Williamsia limnetica]|uniref:TetR family transcriptional regulator n=2 Tax=Williamsia limnetica TaxID=882452 RepID=A0A318RN41_WILLI|nr:TetR family transcriptional regulator [Williamsia limnetica]